MNRRAFPVLLLWLAACSSPAGNADATVDVTADSVTAELTDVSELSHGPQDAGDLGPSPDLGGDGAEHPSDLDSVQTAGELAEADVFVPADFAIEISAPADAEVVSGAILVEIKPVDIAELKLDSLTVSINNVLVFTDTKVPTHFVLDTTKHEGSQLQFLAQASIGPMHTSDAIAVQVNNPPFGFKQVSTKQGVYRNGDEVSIFVSTGKAGMTVVADFQALDSNFQPGAADGYEIGGGKYMVFHTISVDNAVADGHYQIPVTISDDEFELTYEQLDLGLQNTDTVPLRVQGGIFVEGLPPIADDTWDQPISALSGNDFVITGGSAKVHVGFSNYAYVSEIIGIIIAVEGFTGYYQVPIDSSGGTEEILLLLRAYIDPEVPPSQLKLMLALRDSTGRVSPYKQRTMSVQSVGSGDVQVSISWDTPTDVDLHVVEPSGYELWYGDTFSPSGGELDLDSNPACDIDGVNNENIFWPQGAAPPGTYIVRVDFYMDCMEECGWGYCGAKYTVTVNSCGNTEVFDGSFAPGSDDAGGQGDGVTVTSFSNENCGRILRGRLRYEDKTFDQYGFLAATWKPIRHAVVEVHRKSDNELLATGSTDRFGNYELQFSNGKDPGIYLVVKSTTDLTEPPRQIVVKNHPKFNLVYSVSSPSIDENESENPVIDFDIPELVAGGAFNILDKAVDGYDLIRLMTGKDLGELHIYWATGSDTTDTLYCSPFFYDLGICSQEGAVSVRGKDEDRDEYDDMVILREFFKFALEQVSRDDNPGGIHDGTRDDPRRAWSEGVSSFFAGDVVGSRYFVNSRPLGVYLVDDMDSMDTPFAFGTETDTLFGPVSEYLVAASLWDLADDGETEEFDTLANRVGIYDAVFNYLPSDKFLDRGFVGVDLVDFLDGWFCRGWGQQDAVASIVADHREFPYDFDGPEECLH